MAVNAEGKSDMEINRGQMVALLRKVAESVVILNESSQFTDKEIEVLKGLKQGDLDKRSISFDPNESYHSLAMMPNNSQYIFTYELSKGKTRVMKLQRDVSKLESYIKDMLKKVFRH